MNRLKALEAVAEAARLLRPSVRGKRLSVALAALDALPADPEPKRGEVVEVAVWEDATDGDVRYAKPGSDADKLYHRMEWIYHGTTRLPLTGDGA